jgi:hypothetical protein
VTGAHAVTGPRRWAAIAALVALVVSGLLVVAIAPDDTAGSDIAGDALYAAAVYAAVVLIAPRLPPWAVAAIAAGCCIAVELFQLTGIPLAVGAAFAPAMLALGTVFDPRDLAIYVMTVAVACAIDAAIGAVVRGRVGRAGSEGRGIRTP